MSKFHVGDRVRVTGDTAGLGHELLAERPGEIMKVRFAPYLSDYYGCDGVGYQVRDSYSGDLRDVAEQDLRPADIKPQDDAVDHPSHYTRFKGVEVIDLTEQLTFNLGNAVKYVCRAGYKDPAKTIEDLRKAIWYVEREIARLGEEDA